MRILVAGIIAGCSFSPVAQTQCVIPTSVTQSSFASATYAYEINPTETEQLILYTPVGVANPPVVVFIHGGGWHSGGDTYFASSAEILTSFGFAVVSPSYRLTVNGQNPFPAAFSDVRCAVRWIRQNGASIGINGQKIGVFGGSAGGNLAAMLGMNIANSSFDNAYCPVSASVDASVQVVGDYYGLNVTNDPKAFNGGQIGNFGKYVGMAKPAYNEVAFAPAAPETYAQTGAAPFVLAYGSVDKTMPPLQSIDFYGDLNSAGLPASLYEVSGLGHNFQPFDVLHYPQLQASGCALISAYQTYLGQ